MPNSPRLAAIPTSVPLIVMEPISKEPPKIASATAITLNVCIHCSRLDQPGEAAPEHVARLTLKFTPAHVG